MTTTAPWKAAANKENAMSQNRPAPGDLIDVRPLGDKLADTASIALARTDDFEVMRVIMPQGKDFGMHQKFFKG